MKLQDLFAQPNTWVKNHYALDEHQQDVDPLSPCAVAWCLRGALEKCYGRQTEAELAAYAALENTINSPASHLYDPSRSFAMGVIDFNDAAATDLEDVRRITTLANV